MTAPGETGLCWWDRVPGRLEWELDRFRDHGLPVTQEADAISGWLELITTIDVLGERFEVRATLPAGYPDAPPMLVVPGRRLGRHHAPSNGELCVLGDPDGSDWDPADSVARLIDENARALIEDLLDDPETRGDAEIDMPEPASAFFNYDDSQVLALTDPFWGEPPSIGGAMNFLRRDQLLVAAYADGFEAPPQVVLGRVAGSKPQRQSGFWVRIDRDLNGPPTVDEILEGLPPKLRRRLLKKRLRAGETDAVVVGVSFSEEGPQRGDRRATWAACELVRTLTEPIHVASWYRAQALTREARQQRTPELVGLQAASVVVVGAGSLGAPVVLELAKAGVGQIDVIDPDNYDVNNAVRHVLPAAAAGRSKGEAVAARAMMLNPFVNVQHHSWLVGAVQAADDKLRSLVETTDGVVDTTGSATVARVLSTVCQEAEVPLVVSGLSRGSHGADLVVARPGSGCWNCFVRHQEDGNVPYPLEATVETERPVTPVGCSHPAFTGAGFEATELAAITARTAIGLAGRCTYPAPKYGWAVVSFRADPRWQSGPLQIHPFCHRCVP